jgi:hypothetical protein
MLSVYFYRNKRMKTGLQSYCEACVRIALRSENMTENTKRSRGKTSREYKARKRREAGIQGRHLVKPYFWSDRLIRHLDRFIVREKDSSGGSGSEIMRLNGKPLEPNDLRRINAWRSGEQERVQIEAVDRIAQKYDLPLWEIEEAAATYKRDRRSKRKR